MRRFRSLLAIIALGAVINGCATKNTPSPAASPTPRATQTSATLIPTELPSPTPAYPTASVETSTEQFNTNLVYAANGSLVVGGPFGQDARALGILSAFDDATLTKDTVAVIQNRDIWIYGLTTGETTLITLPTQGDVIASDIAFSQDGSHLACAITSLVQDAETAQQLATLYILEPGNESVIAAFPTTEGHIEIIGYDESVLCCMASGHGLLPRVITIDLAAGMYLQDPVIETEGAWAVTKDLAYLLTSELTADADILQAYDLNSGTASDLIYLVFPEGQETVSMAWSPDNSRIAYILRERRRNADQDTIGLGLWIYDTETGTNQQILAEDGAESSIVTWSPDGSYILAQHIGLDESNYYYAIRFDGADRRFIITPQNAVMLGWIPQIKELSINVHTDTWAEQFSQVSGDIQATADMAARFVHESSEIDDKLISDSLSGYLETAGWSKGLADISISTLAQGVSVAHLPDNWIGVLTTKGATRIAHGDLVIDARLDNNRLAVIYGMIGASAVQPGFTLLSQDAGKWLVEWTPQGQKAWITTDGNIAFDGEGIDRLRVTGTSFGITLEPNLFDECHVCAHRDLSGVWELGPRGYQRQTGLPENASYAEIIGELTLPSAYSTIYNTLTRMTLDKPITGLVAAPTILEEIEKLELAQNGKRLVPEARPDNTVAIYDPDTGNSYIFTVKGGIITDLQTASN